MKRNKKLPGLPHEPESEEEMSRRFEQALEGRYNVLELAADTAPSKQRRHVFDGHDTTRMIVSVDFDPFQRLTFLHASFSTEENIKDLAAFKIACLEKLSRISGRVLPKPHHEGFTTVAYHTFFDAIALGIPPR